MGPLALSEHRQVSIHGIDVAGECAFERVCVARLATQRMTEYNPAPRCRLSERQSVAVLVLWGAYRR